MSTPGTAKALFRTAGAVAVLAGGGLHAKLALDSYGTDNLITLFLLNAIGSALVAAWIVYNRSPFPLLAGLGVSSVSLLAFGLSRIGDGVVGFRGIGLEPSPEALATVVAEGVAVAFLSAALIASRRDLLAYANQLRR